MSAATTSGWSGRRTRARVAAVVAAIACLGAFSPAGPEAAGPRVSITVQVALEEVRTDDSGRRVVSHRPVEVAHPGEVLVYTLRAENHGQEAAANARIDDPIPDGTVLLLDGFDGGALPSNASLDGGRTWQAFPAVVEEVGEDGQTRRRPAPAASYTHLRWVLAGSLEPGQAHDVSFKVRVN